MADTIHLPGERLPADTCLYNDAVLWDVAGLKGNTREVLDLLAGSDLSVETELKDNSSVSGIYSSLGNLLRKAKKSIASGIILEAVSTTAFNQSHKYCPFAG